MKETSHKNWSTYIYLWIVFKDMCVYVLFDMQYNPFQTNSSFNLLADLEYWEVL